MSPYDDIQKDDEESFGEEEEKKSDEDDELGQDVDWSAEDFESEESE